MHKFSLSLFTLSLGVALMPLAHAAATPVQEHLLEQVRLGEASKREDLVRQSLYRLELIDPNNPDVVAARMRYLLRQGDTAGAKQQLERLAKLAPESPELKASRDEMKSSTGDGRQELQQARLLGVAGKVDEAIAAYEKLFNGVPDDDDAAIEYWTLVARLPARHNEGINQLKNSTPACRATSRCKRRWRNRCLAIISRKRDLLIWSRCPARRRGAVSRRTSGLTK